MPTPESSLTRHCTERGSPTTDGSDDQTRPSDMSLRIVFWPLPRRHSFSRVVRSGKHRRQLQHCSAFGEGRRSAWSVHQPAKTRSSSDRIARIGAGDSVSIDAQDREWTGREMGVLGCRFVAPKITCGMPNGIWRFTVRRQPDRRAGDWPDSTARFATSAPLARR